MPVVNQGRAVRGEGGREQRADGRIRRMRSQPATSHSLLPQGGGGGALECELHPRVNPRPMRRGWSFGPPGPVGSLRISCQREGCVIFQASQLPFIRGSLPEEVSGATISDPSPPVYKRAERLGAGWLARERISLSRLTSWPSRARLSYCRRERQG